jgi:hypothetical protein
MYELGNLMISLVSLCIAVWILLVTMNDLALSNVGILRWIMSLLFRDSRVEMLVVEEHQSFLVDSPFFVGSMSQYAFVRGPVASSSSYFATSTVEHRSQYANQARGGG